MISKPTELIELSFLCQLHIGPRMVLGYFYAPLLLTSLYTEPLDARGAFVTYDNVTTFLISSEYALQDI